MVQAEQDPRHNMATIPVFPAASDDVSIRMPAAAAKDGEGGGGGAVVNANPEKHLSRLVRYVALGEWAVNAFGAMAFVWATGVLLGGFCASLNGRDFWFAAVMIFIESFRIFSHRYKLDSQSLFGTTRALRWRKSSFLRMLVRPQEGNKVVLVMGLWLNLNDIFFYEVDLVGNPEIAIIILWLILAMAVFVNFSRRPRRPKQWQIRALAIAYVLTTAQKLLKVLLSRSTTATETPAPHLLFSMLPVIIGDVAVLMLNLRPLRIANLTSTSFGCKLISLAKVTSILCLASDLPLNLFMTSRWFNYNFTLVYLQAYFVEPFALLVLSLGSLQNHAAGSLFGRCTDAIMHISFLFYSFVSSAMSQALLLMLGGLLSTVSFSVLSYVSLLVLLLSGNLQIPAAVVQIVLSSLSLNLILSGKDYQSLRKGNMVPAIAVFYVLAICQGSLYIMASFLGLLSCFPRRWLMRRSKLGGKLGAKAIDEYYDRAYAARMEMGVFGVAGSTMSLADFAIESLNTTSSSRDQQVPGLCVLHNILLERRECNSKHLTLRVTSSSTAVSTLVGMIAWSDMEHVDIIRLFAARVTAELAGSLRISSIPGMLKLVSSLLELAENPTNSVVVLVPNQQTHLAIDNGGWPSWVFRFWQRMKQEYWSVPEDPATLLTHQDSSLPVLGMQILEKLACDLDNCVEILKEDTTTNLISKTIGLIGMANQQDGALVCSSLEFLRRLATTGERIGAALRQELWNHPFLLTCLARVLEDDGSSSSRLRHQVWEPAMDIIAKLAMDMEAGLQIGKIQVITAWLLHAFLGRQGPTNMYYDQSLRKVSGEALANLALWGAANCSAILDEPGYSVINDLKNMLSDDDHRYVAASLLLNICEHCSVNQLLSYPPHASEHLSSALTTVMEHLMAAEGKQLESLVNLASEIGHVTRQAFVRELESQTNSGAELVRKLLTTLNSKKIPNPEYPRMRKVIVKIVISILESCHGTVEKMMEERMMEQLLESLTKIERSPSGVEEYRMFYGNIGVVVEDREPMSTLVTRAKELLVQRTTQTAGPPTGNGL